MHDVDWRYACANMIAKDAWAQAQVERLDRDVFRIWGIMPWWRQLLEYV